MIKKPISWEVELTSRCNSRCVGCSRFSEYFYPNPYFKPNLDLKKETLFKALESAPGVDFILFCGNYGDPLLHPDILDILEKIREQYGDLDISIHSNASFGNKDFWMRMARYFQTSGSSIKFSLDGFKDSHEKFRRGTNWSRALENAETFIQAGGRAVWKMIEFNHNKNEFEDARNLASEKGFLKFDHRLNNYPGLDQFLEVQVDTKSPPREVTDDIRTLEQLENWNQKKSEQKKYDFIECRSLERSNLFMDVYGHVWPCCWVGGLPYRPEHELRQWFKTKILDRYEQSFNSLEQHSLEEIMNHAWMAQELEQSWGNSARDEKNPLPATCAKTCGKCR